jgi:hypothetical protein
MEKLVELLNEYRTEKLRREMYVNWADKKATELSEAERINEYEVSQTLDSLNYLRLFIKWLVENDKIDLDTVKEKIWIPCFVWYSNWEITTAHDVDDYKQLLMLLSISDTPIEDLILYLK